MTGAGLEMANLDDVIFEGASWPRAPLLFCQSVNRGARCRVIPRFRVVSRPDFMIFHGLDKQFHD